MAIRVFLGVLSLLFAGATMAALLLPYAMPPSRPSQPAVETMAAQTGAASPVEPPSAAAAPEAEPYTEPALPAVERVAASPTADGATVVRAPGGMRPAPREAAAVQGVVAGPVASDNVPRLATHPVEPRAGVIVLDPGHGRGDPGAVHHTDSGEVDVTEEETNRVVAEYMRQYLEEMGYAVYVTRQGMGMAPPGPLTHLFIVADLLSRVALARAVEADVYISIHSNGSPRDFHKGTEVWYCGKSNQGEDNEALAGLLLQGMINGFRTYGYEPVNRGLHEDAESRTGGEWCPLIVTRESPMPSALVELLFVTNDDDARVLKDDRARQVVGRGLARAVDQFLADYGLDSGQ